MRIVFMGTPAFALPALEALFNSRHELVCVYSRPDSVCGRGKKLKPSLIKQRACELGLEVKTPKSLRDTSEQEELICLKPDVIVVAAYGMILPKEVLEIPKFGCINIHGSSLPAWRGAAPVQRAILAGDKQAGVCLMQMEEGLDTGDFHSCGSVDVANKTKEQLEQELATLGAQELINALPQIEAGTYEWETQDESLVSYAEKIDKSEILLEPELSCEQFVRRVQASSESAPARCVICGKEVAIKRAHICLSDTMSNNFGEHHGSAANNGEHHGSAAGNNGEHHASVASGNNGGATECQALEKGQVFIDKKHLVLGCIDGSVEVDELKPQGKKTMLAKAWVAGLQNSQDRTWSGIERS